MKRVVITGMGILSPIGNSVEAVWDALSKGRSGISFMDEWEGVKGLKTRVGGRVQGFDPRLIARKQRRTMGRMGIMAALAALDAVRDSGLDPLELASEKAGVSMGSTTGSPQAIEKMFADYSASGGINYLEGTTFMKVMSHSAAANVGALLKTRGRLMAPCSACASSTQAIGTGFETIRAGIQEIMVCGGTEELHPSTAGVFDVVHAASKAYNTTPDKTPRPFDRHRDGLAVSEGAGVVILEEMDRAMARNAPIYGEITGYGTSSDGSHMTSPSPGGMGHCMNQALAVAGITPEDLDYINAHATGTTIGDVAEAHALNALTRGRVPVSGTKGYTGHTLAASGAIEVIFCLLMMDKGIIVPTLNLDEIDPDCLGIDHVTQMTEKTLKHILTSNFAFGGVNASLILTAIKGA
ncbi:MAG: beta-ketoacyl-[acyl-carrier-protein] synthase family protein [Desulfobacterium sp.]|nr:beta-ketoacyl-[acyl-carrier-protein] synthase family protein [Desulfobacterium sp.]